MKIHPAISFGMPVAALLLGVSSWKSQAQVEVPIAPPRRPMPPIIVPPPFWPRPLPIPTTTDLQLENQSAVVTIQNGLARTRLTQTFRNTRSAQIEGTYLWALPNGAAPSDFAVTMGGKRIAAEVLEGDKAREIYTGIVAKMRDPAIFEFIDRSLLRARLFPVPANGEVKVELTYSQSVAGQFNLPLRVPGDKAGAKASVQIQLSASDLKAVYSPSHSVEIKRDGNSATISGEFGASSNDFSLVWTQGNERIGAQIMAIPGDRFGEKDGFFLLLAAPSDSAQQTEIAAKDVIFVCDTSGSMEGEKIEQARGALKTLLGSLRSDDRFGLITFSTDVRPFKTELSSASKANVDAAKSWVDDIRAVGATNISDALEGAQKMVPNGDKNRPKQIVFLTDGLPTVGETSVDAILKKFGDFQNARVFTFGVGYDVNTRLLDSLAEENRGASDYVTPKENIEAKVGALYGKIAYPVLTDLKLNWPGVETYDVYPKNLPDLFRGGQSIVAGRFKGDAGRKISVSGQSPRGTEIFGGQVVTGNDDAFKEIPRLWATRKVGFLLDDAARNNRPLAGETRDEILALSKKWGIVTPLTAALATEDETPVFAGGPRRPMPVPMLRAQNGVGGGGFAADAGAPIASSGRLAVESSKARAKLRDGRTDDAAPVQAALKNAGGKTFVLRGDVWTDSDFDAAKLTPKVVKFASQEYFELARDARVAQWLSVGAKIVFVWKGAAIRVEN